MRELWKQLGFLAAIIIVIAVVVAIFHAWPSSQTAGPSTPTSKLPPQTIPTTAQIQQLQNSPAFQYLVSYTDKGFEPQQLTVKKGQTVRFADNSSRQLWVASIGSGGHEIYPGNSSCGGSTFDSCAAFSQGNYWEFTFTETGTWDFQNNAHSSDTGTVVVQ